MGNWKFGHGDDPSASQDEEAEHDFEVIDAGDFFWFREDNSDPYGMTRDVTYDRIREEVSIRCGGNDRAPHFVAVASAPVTVLIDLLRKAGYEVTKKQ